MKQHAILVCVARIARFVIGEVGLGGLPRKFCAGARCNYRILRPSRRPPQILRASPTDPYCVLPSRI